jgi:translation initiation factor 1
MPDNIVYSTDPDWRSTAKDSKDKPRQAEPVRVSFRRGHKGSGMTSIERLQMHPAGKEELLKKFKKKLGVGGTVKLGALEIQGDHRDLVETELKALGYKVKRLG